jgi:hypothetical protein
MITDQKTRSEDSIEDFTFVGALARKIIGFSDYLIT